MLSKRMSIRTVGAMSGLCFRKAQHLPVSVTHAEDKEVKVKWSMGGTEKADVDNDEDNSFDNEDTDAHILNGESNEDGAYLEDGSWRQPERFSLIQVVANDVNSNIISIPLMGMKAIMMIPVVIAIGCLLISKIGNAVFLCVAWFFCFTILMGLNGMGQAAYYQGFLYWSGKRLQYLEELLFNIRVVKACGR